MILVRNAPWIICSGILTISSWRKRVLRWKAPVPVRINHCCQTLRLFQIEALVKIIYYKNPLQIAHELSGLKHTIYSLSETAFKLAEVKFYKIAKSSHVLLLVSKVASSASCVQKWY